MRKLFSISCLLILTFTFASCEKDDDDEVFTDPYSPEWFANKEFTAEPGNEAIQAGISWWVLSMDGKSGVGYDGSFKVVPYWTEEDEDWVGGVLTSHKSYTGKYQIDFKNNRIFITYDGYSANAVWYFGDEEDQTCWPHWKPNRYVQVPENAIGELAGLTFYSGNVMTIPNDPTYDED